MFINGIAIFFCPYTVGEWWLNKIQEGAQFYFWVTLVAEKRDSPTEQITYLCVDYYNYFQSYNYVYLIII